MTLYHDLIYFMQLTACFLICHHEKPVLSAYGLLGQLDTNMQILSAVLLIHLVQAPWFSKHPQVIWDGSLETPLKPCLVQVEDQVLTANHPVEAILLAFCLHWVVDLVYQPALKSFYTLLEHLLGLTATKASVTVVTVLSALKS